MRETLRKVADKILPVAEQAPNSRLELFSAASTAIDRPADTGISKGTQNEAYNNFIKSIQNGDSVNEALRQAVFPMGIEVDQQSDDRYARNRLAAETGVRFWDAMGPHEEGEAPAPAIDRALDGFAPDGGSWLEAKAAFTAAIERGVQVDIALDIALGTIKEGAETHPEVAKDRFYAGIDPNYAENEHIAGRKYGVRIGTTERGIDIGIGRDQVTKRQRDLGRLAAQHQRDTK